MRFRNKSFVDDVKNWLEFFQKFSDFFADQIIERIHHGRINLDKKYVINQDRINQLVFAIKGVTLQEATSFIFL